RSHAASPPTEPASTRSEQPQLAVFVDDLRDPVEHGRALTRTGGRQLGPEGAAVRAGAVAEPACELADGPRVAQAPAGPPGVPPSAATTCAPSTGPAPRAGRSTTAPARSSASHNACTPSRTR